MKDFSKILHLLQCTQCKGDLQISPNNFHCTQCNKEYPIIDDIPRFVDDSFYSLNKKNPTIESKTKNYFGYEWEHFKDWGFIKDQDVPDAEIDRYKGGRISDRENAFNSKCRLLEKEISGKVVLDAGCGNGRYTYEARKRGDDKSILLGVDIGYGSVESSFDNTKEFENIFILQASLFNLPLKNHCVDSCFSNGVLMHTGNAKRAFTEVARTVKAGGVFVAHVYGKLNPVWEFNDWWLRQITTRLSISWCMRLSSAMAKLSGLINKLPNGFTISNLFLRLQPSLIHMFDWYSAPTASHHTYKELFNWYNENNFTIADDVPQKLSEQKSLTKRPWGINAKGKRR